jgi:hypothetical protein
VITSHFLRKSIFQSIDQTIKNRVLPQQGCLAKKGLEELSHSKVRKGPPSRAPKSNILPHHRSHATHFPPNVPSVTLPSGICSSHHPIERDVASNQQRAPNQQRHKHCLLALTWHWPISQARHTVCGRLAQVPGRTLKHTDQHRKTLLHNNDVD